MHERIRLLVFFSVLFLFLTIVCETVKTKEACPNVRNSIELSRKRRHLVFPDRSNMILTMSVVKAIMTHAPSGWNIALEIDVMFPLPDSNFTLKHQRRKLHRRQIRQLWEGMENAINLAPVFEKEFVQEVGWLYDELSDPHYCDKINDCPFSLLYFLLPK
ncbi:uncharacterized protein LOC113510838 isoform X2 [Galleria mellonella]|uniref:Uncharacterized protein LOC113510838 isoform X2 n=1 Tax=Galleria mellonella TaxID=7137 RepID=A0ABM3MLQ0_GALME|nr:uncharacterized protein LOC113510838 isoform X2 [Galleria mellonella]